MDPDGPPLERVPLPDNASRRLSLPLLPFALALVAAIAFVGFIITAMIVWSGGHMSMMHGGSAGLDQAPVVSDAARVTVEMSDLTFFPANLTVDAGTEVAWINRDPVPHEVIAEDDSFSSGIIPAGESWSAVLDQPGVYRYVCRYHPGMEATLTVR